MSDYAYKVIVYDDLYANGVDPMPPGLLSRVKAARFAVRLSRIMMVVTLAVVVWAAVMTVIDLLSDKSIEQLPIPLYLVDNCTDADGGSYVLNYESVKCNRGEYFRRGL